VTICNISVSLKLFQSKNGEYTFYTEENIFAVFLEGCGGRWKQFKNRLHRTLAKEFT
jgi:hypothetical protein